MTNNEKQKIIEDFASNLIENITVNLESSAFVHYLKREFKKYVRSMRNKEMKKYEII